jgi:hypothetical protein
VGRGKRTDCVWGWEEEITGNMDRGRRHALGAKEKEIGADRGRRHALGAKEKEIGADRGPSIASSHETCAVDHRTAQCYSGSGSRSVYERRKSLNVYNSASKLPVKNYVRICSSRHT